MGSSVSIIIPTRNRAASLKATLESLAKVDRPAGWLLETIVVDNGSTDDTQRVVGSLDIGMPLIYVRENRPGISVARNSGMNAASGDIFLWMDDDLRPPDEWIRGMCEPMLKGGVDGVAGGIALAPHLQKPWMDLWHRAWLASTECLDAQNPGRFIGANMAFRRRVLDTVPAFDPELGAGALGMADETLFAHQMLNAGLSIGAALNVESEHHFDESRLSRAAFLDTAAKLGRSEAYVAHHWEHRAIPDVDKLLLRAKLRHAKYCLTRGANRSGGPVEVWEMQLTKDIHFYEHYKRESKRARNYEKFGYRRLDEPAIPLQTPTAVRTTANAS